MVDVERERGEIVGGGRGREGGRRGVERESVCESTYR
jgi:hypothetical protein